eukprot:5541702-Alexandrium_andersonii.AAC.1
MAWRSLINKAAALLNRFAKNDGDRGAFKQFLRIEIVGNLLDDILCVATVSPVSSGIAGLWGAAAAVLEFEPEGPDGPMQRHQHEPPEKP